MSEEPSNRQRRRYNKASASKSIKKSLRKPTKNIDAYSDTDSDTDAETETDSETETDTESTSEAAHSAPRASHRKQPGNFSVSHEHNTKLGRSRKASSVYDGNIPVSLQNTSATYPTHHHSVPATLPTHSIHYQPPNIQSWQHLQHPQNAQPFPLYQNQHHVFSKQAASDALAADIRLASGSQHTTSSDPKPSIDMIQVEVIQKTLDMKRSQLFTHPEQVGLGVEVTRLQEELNKALDAVMVRSKNKTLSSRSSNGNDVARESQKAPTVDEEVQKAASQTGDTSKEDEKRSASVPKSTKKFGTHPARFEREGAGNTFYHHLCSDCGSVRNNSYHQKNPRDVNQAPNLNYCEKCKDARIERGLFEGRHFCFNCGIARSRRFHDDHSLNDGDELLVNYCRPCEKEIETQVDLQEGSVAVSFP